jgi:hypothetical protein
VASIAGARTFFVGGVVFFVGAYDGPVVFFGTDAGGSASWLDLDGFRGTCGFLLLRAEKWVVGCDTGLGRWRGCVTSSYQFLEWVPSFRIRRGAGNWKGSSLCCLRDWWDDRRNWRWGW